MWINNYDDPKFEINLKNIYLAIRPMFEELHTYVRRALNTKYGTNVVSLDGPIPMHVLGNVWAQSWVDVSGLFDFNFIAIIRKIYIYLIQYIFPGGPIRCPVPESYSTRCYCRTA